MFMKKKYYIVPSVRFVHVESENWIATSQAGTDTLNGDFFKYEEEVTIKVDEYFNGEWQ